MKLNKIPKRSEVEEQQYYRSKRKRLVQEDKEKEWEIQVKEFLSDTTDLNDISPHQQRQECFNLDCCDCQSPDYCCVR